MHACFRLLTNAAAMASDSVSFVALFTVYLMSLVLTN